MGDNAMKSDAPASNANPANAVAPAASANGNAQSATPVANQNQTQNQAPGLSQDRQKIIGEIRAKWGKFSEHELSDLKGSDDLSQQLSSKYAIPHNDARRDVSAFLKGRAF